MRRYRSSSSTIIHLPHRTLDPKPKHTIRLHRPLIPQLRRRLRPRRGYAILEPLPRAGKLPTGQRVRKGQVLGHQAQLDQHGGLVPRDVLVAEPVATDVDDGGEGDAEGFVGRRDSWETAIII